MEFSFSKGRKALWEALTSQGLAVWLIGLETAVLLVGSVIMAQNREVTGAMSGGPPLFLWLTSGPLVLTWWLWAAILVLALLAINTICCSVESVRRKKGGLVTLLAPQVIHAGFLLILVAHLMSTLGASKLTGELPEGALARLPSGFDLFLAKVESGTRPNAEVELLSQGIVLKRGALAPNHPVFFRGYGFYLQDVTMQPFPAAVIEVSLEPGAPWALLGAVFFTAGAVLLALLKTRQE
ncbi:MAG: hypothetical protein M0Z61_10480 [Nitrospiraceae bacterium]|nr:hypothetical protein [Nitrospiraceae bacterium]